MALYDLFPETLWLPSFIGYSLFIERGQQEKKAYICTQPWAEFSEVLGTKCLKSVKAVEAQHT